MTSFLLDWLHQFGMKKSIGGTRQCDLVRPTQPLSNGKNAEIWIKRECCCGETWGKWIKGWGKTMAEGAARTWCNWRGEEEGRSRLRWGPKYSRGQITYGAKGSVRFGLYSEEDLHRRRHYLFCYKILLAVVCRTDWSDLRVEERRLEGCGGCSLFCFLVLWVF